MTRYGKSILLAGAIAVVSGAGLSFSTADETPKTSNALKDEAVIRPHVIVAEASGEFHEGRGQPFEAVAVGAVSHDAQACAGPLTGRDGHVDPFVGHQGGHHEKMAAGDGRVGVIEDGVNGWIHDRCFAIIVSADPTGNVA